MPLEQLLALYGYGSAPPASLPAQKDGTDKQHDTSTATTGESSNSNSSLDPNSSATSQTGGEPSSALWRLSSAGHLMDVDGEESSSGEDDDYEEEEDNGEDWRRSIQVGADYQAQVPDGLCRYDDVLPYENEDTLLWDPTALHGKEVEEYLKQVSHLKRLEAEQCGESPPLIPPPDAPHTDDGHIRDDQQALYLLHQCGHKAEEALRRRRMQLQKISMFDPMTSWSEEECSNFEEGLRIYGKDFYLIQKNKVRACRVLSLDSSDICPFACRLQPGRWASWCSSTTTGRRRNVTTCSRRRGASKRRSTHCTPELR